MVDGKPPGSIDADELATAVRSSTVPIALLDLGLLRLVAISPRGAELLGLDSDVPTNDVLGLVADPDAARRALGLMRTGALEGYEARRRLRRADGEIIESRLWVHALDETPDRNHAIVVVVARNGHKASSAPTFADVDATVGTLDGKGCINRVSADVARLLGYTSAGCIGMALAEIVHPSDIGVLLDAFKTAATDDANVVVQLRVRSLDGTWQTIHLTVSPFDDPAATFGFAAVPAHPLTDHGTDEAADRIGELERHLTRIAREVEAAGLIGRRSQIPDAARFPGLDDLSSRQWQILTRLLRGERVPTIARTMYLSPSTVRNHLSALFRKYGVHSQAELLEKFRPNE